MGPGSVNVNTPVSRVFPGFLKTNNVIAVVMLEMEKEGGEVLITNTVNIVAK